MSELAGYYGGVTSVVCFILPWVVCIGLAIMLYRIIQVISWCWSFGDWVCVQWSYCMLYIHSPWTTLSLQLCCKGYHLQSFTININFFLCNYIIAIRILSLLCFVKYRWTDWGHCLLYTQLKGRKRSKHSLEKLAAAAVDGRPLSVWMCLQCIIDGRDQMQIVRNGMNIFANINIQHKIIMNRQSTQRMINPNQHQHLLRSTFYCRVEFPLIGIEYTRKSTSCNKNHHGHHHPLWSLSWCWLLICTTTTITTRARKRERRKRREVTQRPQRTKSLRTQMHFSLQIRFPLSPPWCW